MPLLFAAVLASACSLNIHDDRNGPPVIPGPNTTLAFEDMGTLALAPGESRTISVLTSPPGNYEVSFALLGDVIDASLNKSKVAAGEDGVASVTLKAAKSATTFRVRASLKDGVDVDLPVAVSDKGFGSIRAEPVYGGAREVTEWVASAVIGSCKTIAELLPDKLEAAQNATAPPDEAPLIKSVPVGPNIAIVIRAGKYMWGCADEPKLKAGEELTVKVNVINKPIDLLATDLDVTLSLTSDPVPYGFVMGGAAELLTSALLPASFESAAAALLDGMKEKAPPEEVEAFEMARAAQSWDALATQHIEALGVSPQKQILGWIEGKLAPGGEPAAVSSQITGRLRSAEAAPGKAHFIVSKLGDIDAEAAGFPDTHLMTWTADASDTVMLGGTIYWMPSRYLGNVALEGAKEEMPGVTTMPEALASLVGCEALGASLAGYGSCDAACMTSLCVAALDELWEKSLNASAEAGLVGEITITASGAAKVNEDAAPMSFDGQWLGTISNTVIAASLTGKFVGTAPEKGADDDDAPESP